jgi:hypothetical protein
LKWLNIEGGNFSQQGLDALKKALPKCEIDIQKR